MTTVLWFIGGIVTGGIALAVYLLWVLTDGFKNLGGPIK